MISIENRVFIKKNLDEVFDITNDISNWKHLFTEYQDSKVLHKSGMHVTFRLTTWPNEKGEIYEWESERIINKRHYLCVALRRQPLLPFKFMKIVWEYKGHGEYTEMIWRQEFEVDERSGYSNQYFARKLDGQTKTQIAIIRDKLEGMESYD